MTLKLVLLSATLGIGLLGSAAFGQQAPSPPPATPRAPPPLPPQSPAQAAAAPTNANESRRPNNASELPAFPGQTRAHVDEKGVSFTRTVWATGLDHPWGLQLLPDGRGLVTERLGRIRYIEIDGRLSAPLSGVPAVSALPAGQAGLFDIALDPKFASNHRIYLAYTVEVEDGSTLRVMRAKLVGQALTEQKVIFQASPVVPASPAAGGRLLFGRDGALFVTVGDRFSAPTDQKTKRPEGFTQDYAANQGQWLKSDLGKIVRIDTEGRPAKGNPFLGRTGARAEIYSIGQRNMEAIAIHPKTGALWSVDFGPRGGDEVNIVRAGKNYGWPSVTYGVDYFGAKILRGVTQQEGTEQPIYYWDPSFSPSGLLFYTGDKFPAWKGSLFVGGLSVLALGRLTLNGDRVVGEERLLKDLHARIRDVRQGADGLIYVVTDADDGQVIRLSPK